MRQLLSSFYMPRKTKVLKQYLKACKCSPLKSAGNTNRESDESKKRTSIKASQPYEILQVDVYNYKDVHYLTAIDVYSRKDFAI